MFLLTCQGTSSNIPNTIGQLNEAVLPPQLLTIEFTPQDREMGIIIQKALRKVVKEAKLTTIGPSSSSNTDNAVKCGRAVADYPTYWKISPNR